MSIELQNAYKHEAAEIDIEQMMLQMMNGYTESIGAKPTAVDKTSIRRMILARKFVEQEKLELLEMKKVIVAEWDARIAKKTAAITDLNDYMKHWLETSNNEEKLVLDVGTLALRENASSLSLKKDKTNDARIQLANEGRINFFLKPAELDEKLLIADYQKRFDAIVEEKYKFELLALQEQGKVSKKKEGELRKKLEKQLLPAYVATLPEFIEFTPSSKSLALTSKVDLS